MTIISVGTLQIKHYSYDRTHTNLFLALPVLSYKTKTTNEMTKWDIGILWFTSIVIVSYLGIGIKNLLYDILELLKKRDK